MASKNKINLLPKDQFEYTTFGKFIKWCASVGRWIVVFTEFVVICAFLSRFYFDTKLADLFDEVKQKQVIVNSAFAFEENFRKTQERMKVIKTLLAEQEKPSLLITEVSRLLPADVSLIQISIDQASLGLSGYCFSEKSLSLFLASLLTHPRLTEVALSNISTSKEIPSRIDFSLSATIKK